ncbi:discoidin domain-containing protein [Sphaerisporangium sp. B11E5]|uniref:discoidin domain-containing protein n=1 Tax=Sphaerisporangium sp. B11E5 TaxID=3153563 RepID=UPI00325C6D5F
MNHRWPAAALTTVIAAATLAATARPAAAAPLGSADFLKVSGTVLKKNSGTGATFSLRGTNLGGWLTHEEWMSPLGDFAHDRTGWTATASAGDAALAIDGDGATRWSTNAPMRGGEWLKLNLGAPTRFNRITFDYTEFPGGDFARGFTVAVSTDNSVWTTVPFDSGGGLDTVTTARFAPVRAQYVRVTQTGSAGDWWSIGEFNVFNDADSFKRTQWTATASGGTPAPAMLDGAVATRWTSNTVQVPGQWVQLDLGARMTINNVQLDAVKNSDDAEDYPRGYTVQLSDDRTTWTQVAAGTGTPKATNISFPAARGRYVRVNQTGTSYRWWSIGEISVALNRDDYGLQLTLDQRFGRTGAQAIRDAHEQTWITAADLDNLAAMGLNYVRLPIGWTTLLNTDGTWKPDPWSKIDWVVDQLASHGIHTLLDLHTVPGGGCPWLSCGRIGPNPNGFWGSATYQNWVEDIWTAIATRYAGRPAVAGYDLINEPLIGFDFDAAEVTRVSAYYDRLYDAVRAVDPDHIIVIGAFPDPDRITPPSTHGWSNVVYELHPYDMDNRTSWDHQNGLVTNKLADLPGLLSSWGVPLLYGEFCLYYFDDVWARWLAGLNAQQQSWSTWAYKVRGTDADEQGYWGFHYNRPAPVPILNTDDSPTMIRKLRRFTTSTFTRNDRLTALATTYAAGLSTYNPVPISRTTWTATASTTSTSGTINGAIDGNPATRWDTGAPQTPGQWYQIDLGSPQPVALITLQTALNAKQDYPRGFRIQLSLDGTTWTTATTGAGFAWKRPISIPPQTTRYVRITQTGTSTYWWSIDEITMYSSF